MSVMPTTKKKSSKTKKRKKNKHYKTGVHISPKCPTPINYRSGWEKTVCQYLDENPDIVSYLYESFKIPYINKIGSDKVRWYIPDFLLTYVDGHKALVEVKRENQTTNLKVVKKANAGKLWAEKNNATYEFWTEKMILPLQRKHKKLQEAAKAVLPSETEKTKTKTKKKKK